MKYKFLLPLVAFLSATGAFADWSYDSSVDPMSSKKTNSAMLESNSSLSLGFPYSGKNFGQITVRQHPKYGTDVILQIDKGQILCSSYSGCPIEVRFDEAPPVKFEGLESDDHDSKTIFFKNAQKFISSAKKAKKILVRVNIYQNGAPIMEFYSSKFLDWQSR